MKTSVYLIALVLVFFMGGITNIMVPTKESAVEEDIERPDPINPVVVQPTETTNPDLPENAQDPIKIFERFRDDLPNDHAQALSLPPTVLDAILSQRPLNDQLATMGLDEEAIVRVNAIQGESRTALQKIEKRRSHLVSDEQGDYIEIAAFPLERERWLANTESDLWDFTGDDRAAVILRMIAFTKSHKTVGLFRRELFIRDPAVEGGPMLIEERRFDPESGESLSNSYDAHRSEDYWGHLLNLSGEQEE